MGCIPLPLFSIVVVTNISRTTSPLVLPCACQRLSLLTSFEETWRLHCFPEDRPEHRLYSTEESFVRLERHRDELRERGERGEREMCLRRRLLFKLWTMWGWKPSACLQVISGYLLPFLLTNSVVAANREKRMRLCSMYVPLNSVLEHSTELISHKNLSFQQQQEKRHACKPQSYASLKLRPSVSVCHMCRV